MRKAQFPLSLFILSFLSAYSAQAAELKESSSYGQGVLADAENSSGWLRTGVGIYNLSRDTERATEARFEYFFKKKIWLLQPFLGVQYNTTADFYGFSGFGIDIYFTRNLYLFPSLAVGYYKHTRGIDLGHPIEFREGLELGWHFNNDVRVGANIVHMSNSMLGKTNPGQETLSFVVSIPIFLDRPTRFGSRYPASAAPGNTGCN